MKLIKYEIKKICSSPYLIGVVAVLLMASMIFFGMSVKEESKYDVKKNKLIPDIIEMYETDPEYFFSEYQRLYDSMMLDSFVPEFNYGEEGVADDFDLFSYVHRYVTADAEYHEKLDKVIKESERIKNRLEKVSELNKNTFAYRYQIDVIERYTYLNEKLTLDDGIIVGWDSYFSARTELIFVYVAVLICAVYAATNDYYNGFYAIEKTCVNGRRRTAVAKYIALLIVGCVITVVFFFSSIAVTYFSVGLSDPTVPIQNVSGGWMTSLEMCPYELSILEFLALSLILKLASVSVSLSVIVAFASLTRKNLYGIISGAVLLLLSFISSGLDVTFSEIKYVNVWSVYNLNDVLGRYRAIGMFNRSIPILAVTAVVFLLIVAVSAFLHVYSFSYVKKPPQKRKLPKLDLSKWFPKFKLRIPKPRYGTGLFSYEYRKRLWILPLLVLLVIAKCDWATEYYERLETTYYRIYREYIEELGGEYTEEKGQYIQEEYERSMEIYSMHDEAERAFLQGEITAKQFSNYCSDYAEAQAKLPVLERLGKTSSYLGRLYRNGIVGSFVNEYEYYRFANIGTDWYLTVFLWILSVSAFMMERRKTSSSSPPAFLINTTPKGRLATFGTKYALTAGFAFAAYVIFEVVDIGYHTSNLDRPEWSTLLISLEQYSFAPATVTVGEHLVLVLLTSLLGVMISVTLVFMFSNIMRDTLSAFVLSAVILFAPGLLTASGVEFFKYMDLAKLTDTDAIYRIAGESDAGLYVAFALVLALIAVASSVLSAISISKVKKGK